MIKKISVDQLKPGMFVDDFNCGWMEHPFFSNKILIKDKSMIDKVIKQGIKEIYIDSSKGLDVSDAKSKEDADKEIKDRLDTALSQRHVVEQKSSFEEEITKVKSIRNTALKLARNVMEDIRVGKQIELEKVDNLVGKLVDSVFRNQSAMMTLSLLKESDEYTFLHSVNVCTLMVTFCKHLGIDREITSNVGIGAILHDVGKMKVPQGVLNKNGKLTDEEFAIMKSHVEYSGSILTATNGIPDSAISVAVLHHERFDGSGYPNHVKGGDIDIYGRMAAIVDVFDAITSDRCYHKGMDVYIALSKMLEWSKFHFDDKLTTSFINCVGIYPVGSLVKLNNGILAVVIKPGEEDLLSPTVRTVYDTKKVQFVLSKDIVLSSKAVKESGLKIAAHESPAKWKIEPKKFLPDI